MKKFIIYFLIPKVDTSEIQNKNFKIKMKH